MIDMARKFEVATARRRALELQLKQGAVKHEIVPSGSMDLSIGQDGQEQAYRHFRNWPYAIFNLISKRVASQPVHAGEIVGASPNPETRSLRAQILKNQLPSRIYQKAVVDKDLEMLPDHPVIDSLCRPNPLQRKFEFLYFSAANLFLTGECYWVGGVSETEDGLRVEVWAIPSSWVQPIHKKGLFSEFRITPTGVVEGFVLPAENVSRTYLADPSDPKGAYSPVQGVMSAVRTDDYIQTSQQQLFERGLDPNLIVTVAKERQIDGVERRPILTGAQRRQFIRSIREMWSRQVNKGDPAILDGLIESVHKMNLTPQEMDFLNSSDLVKRRIFQATGLNPITAGEIVGSNRAQAAEAERQSCVNAINPIIDALSESMTDFLGPMFDSPERLVVWIEPCEPMDRELHDKRWEFARKNDDVTSNEYRGMQLNLEPREEAVPRNQLLSTVGGMTGTVQILTAMGNGFISSEAAKTALMLFLEIDEELADGMVGGSEEPAAIPAPTPEPPAEEPEEVIDDEAPEEVDEIESRSTKSKKTPGRLKRTDIGKIHGKQVEQMQEVVAAKMADPFRRSVQETARRIAGRSDKPDKENAEKQAERIVKATFNLDKANKEIFTAAAEVLPVVFAAGVMAELAILEALTDEDSKQTSAEEIAQRLEIDTSLLPFSIGRMPEWLLAAARESMGEAFAQDYWQKIGETTRDDIQITVRDGIESGLSMRKVAAAIAEKHGDQYSKIRAMLVARTETPNALLAGHAKGILQLEEETGVSIGKEWLSAFATFTRASHAALDGKRTKTADGMFTLDGVKIPWPAHTNLPAKNRANCLCNIVSTVSADALE